MRRKLTQTYLQLVPLPKHSLKVAEWIDKLRPSWLGYALADQWNDELFLKITIPPTKGHHELLIYDLQRRITVAFGGWHAHAYFSQGLESAVRRTIGFVDAIMAEEWVVACWKSSHTRDLASDVSYGAYTKVQLAALPSDTLIFTRSWNGTYDRQYREPI